MNFSRKRALQKYRSRLSERGLVRFEVLARAADRHLIRSIARHLDQGDPKALRLRAAIRQILESNIPNEGGIMASLQRSQLIGAELDLVRVREEGRDVEI